LEKTLFIIDKEKDIEKIRNKLKETDIVMTFNFSTREALKTNNISSPPIKNYISPNIHDILITWLKDWANKKINNDQNFKEFCFYNGISYWWFCDTLLWYHPIHKKTFRSLFYYTDILLNCIEKEAIKKIDSYTSNTIINSILKEITKNYKIISKINSSQANKKLIEKKIQLIEKIKNIKFNVRKKYAKKNFKNFSKKDILFITHTSLHKNGRDLFLQDIIDNYKEKSNYSIIDIDYTKDILKINKGIKNRKKHAYIPFEAFSSTNKNAKWFFQNKWNEIKNNKEFQNSLTYRKISYWDIMKSQFKFIFHHRLPNAANYIATSQKMIKTLDPKLIFLIDETFMYGRSIVHASKKEGVKTIALQHGLIWKESFEYRNKIENLKELNTPLADLTLVMGKHAKDFLTKNNNYKEENVIITGQPRYDEFKKIKLDSQKRDKKNILFISQPITEEVSADYVETSFIAFSELKKLRKDINFIIKLHPREENLKYYQNLADKYKIHPTFIRDIPVQEVLKDSDVIVTMHSTVGIEALLLRKPVVIVNTTGKVDSYPYPEGENIPKCTNKEELIKVLLNLDNLKSDQSFLKYHLYTPPGGTVNKIKNIIDKSLEDISKSKKNL